MDGRSTGIGAIISSQSGNLRSLKVVRNFRRCYILLCSDLFLKEGANNMQREVAEVVSVNVLASGF